MGLQRYFGLSGKVVLITGATGGIGSAMVEAFAAAGAHLAITGNEDDLCRELVSGLTQQGIRA